MQLKFDGMFTEFELSPEEEIQALNNSLLLAYLHTKRAVYATAFMSAQLATGDKGEILELERQRAKLSILTELINEVTQAQASQISDQTPE